MLKKLISNIKGIELNGLFFYQIKSEYLIVGVGPNACSNIESLSEFSVSRLKFDVTDGLLSITLGRGFSVIHEEANVSEGKELPYELIEFTFNYCIHKNCIIDSSVSITPGKYVYDVCLVMPISLNVEKELFI